jgi:hypothetical protein
MEGKAKKAGGPPTNAVAVAKVNSLIGNMGGGKRVFGSDAPVKSGGGTKRKPC